MSRQNLWLLGAALGVATVLTSMLMFLVAVAVALFIVPLARRPGGLAAVSGELTAFGALWFALIARESASGGTLDNATFWAAVGAVPLLIGVALLIWVLKAPASGATTRADQVEIPPLAARPSEEEHRIDPLAAGTLLGRPRRPFESNRSSTRTH